MNPEMTEIWSGALFLQQDALAQAVFDVVCDNLGIAGYGIARRLDKDPAVIRGTLSSLVKKKLLWGGSEIGDNFTLTKTGFGVKEAIK